MKSIFIGGSRKFFDDVEKLVELLGENDIKAETAGKVLNQEDTFETEKSALFRAFEKIGNSEIVYIVAKDGYIGLTVALEIAYAHAKNKEIISSEEIKDLSARSLISKVMKPGDLIEYIIQPS